VGERSSQLAIVGAVKLALNLRLVALLLTVAWLPLTEHARLDLLLPFIGAVTLTSLVPLLAWQRIGPWLLAHPAALLPDIVLAIVILGAVGLDTPFGLYVLSTALVGGLLYGSTGAGVLSVALLLAYAGGALLGQQEPTLVEALGTPMLVPVAAFGGAGFRMLLLRQQRAAAALADSAMREAALLERTRLAREMHDTLAKTLHGIALQAHAVGPLLALDPERATREVAGLADNIERATQEARALLVDLRTDDLEQALASTLSDSLRRWAEHEQVQLALDIDEAVELGPDGRYEVFCIVREALRNATEHGAAERIWVTLRTDPFELTVRDDGEGFVPPTTLSDLTAAGHFGLIGMQERAARIGAEFTLDSAPGSGTSIRVRACPSSPSPPPRRATQEVL
jgi:signal transduction histidine kinase